MTDHLTHAIILAAKTHAGQVDKGGQPYILHPLHLMAQFDDPTHRLVAVLHDVIEDGDAIGELHFGPIDYPGTVIVALDALTRRKGESYDDYIDRVALNPIATAVKLADLKHNMDLRRLGDAVTAVDRQRLAKYRRAYRRLTTGAWPVVAAKPSGKRWGYGEMSRAILLMLPTTAPQVAERFGLHPKKASSVMAYLYRAGLVVKEGTGRGRGHIMTYSINPAPGAKLRTLIK